MNDTLLDKESFRLLQFIYESSECSINDINHFLKTKDIHDSIRMFGLLFPLYKEEYLAIYNPKLNILDSTSFEKYIEACQNNSLALLSPECIACILPKGKAYVESRHEKSDNLNMQIAPLEQIASSAKQQAHSAEAIAKSAKDQSISAKRVSESAEVQAELALKQSKKADIKGWIALIISVIALCIDFIVNRETIIPYIIDMLR